MTFPVRIDFAGAAHHVESSRNGRASNFEGDFDATLLLQMLGKALKRFKSQVLAFCLMTNNCHWVIATQQAGLSLLKR